MAVSRSATPARTPAGPPFTSVTSSRRLAPARRPQAPSKARLRESRRAATLEKVPHVLVADDDAWILRMVATVLEKRGYSVETAVDGEDALARALARTPDLLITDVMMPKMDGWSLVRQLRSHAELGMLPVIFLTALSSEDDRIRGFRLGADDYVTKPFRFEELDLRVAKTLRRTAQTVQETRDQLAGTGLRGDLSQVGLSSLLVLIEMERKTGLLQVRSVDGHSAQVLVREG